MVAIGTYFRSKSDMENKNNEKNKNDIQLSDLFTLSLLMVCICLGYGVYIMRIIPEMPTRGTFGDMFGFINALFSGLALAGVIFAIFLQRKDLKLQADELAETRKEFIITRLTNIIYREREKVESLINQVKINFAPRNFVGDHLVLNGESVLLNLKRTFEKAQDDFEPAELIEDTKNFIEGGFLRNHEDYLEKMFFDFQVSLDFVRLNVRSDKHLKEKDKITLSLYYSSSLFTVYTSCKSLKAYLEEFHDVKKKFTKLHTHLTNIIENYDSITI